MKNTASSAQLRREIRTLRKENDELQDRLDQILNIAAPEEGCDVAGEDDCESEEEDIP